MSREWVPTNDDSGLKKLIGKDVESIYLSKCRSYIKFELKDNDPICWVCYGNCCSDAWIEHISEPAYGAVIGIDCVELGAVLPSKQQVDILYGVRIKLSPNEYGYSDHVFIEFRSSSNGCYGAFITDTKIPDNVEFVKVTEGQ